jgi:hypothetical protein
VVCTARRDRYAFGQAAKRFQTAILDRWNLAKSHCQWNKAPCTSVKFVRIQRFAHLVFFQAEKKYGYKNCTAEMKKVAGPYFDGLLLNLL